MDNFEITERPEPIPKGTAESIINNIIWGDSDFNPNKKNNEDSL